MRFTVAKDGAITEIVLIQGSGSAILDQAAIAILDGARAPPFPPGVSGDRVNITVPITYALHGASR